jgi:similar to spore coat protein
MGFFEMLMGNDMSLSDKDIAFDMLKDSKFGLTGLTMALAESTNPQLRQMLSTQLNGCVLNHHKLSDIALRKDWYQAYATPTQQVLTDVQDSQNALS